MQEGGSCNSGCNCRKWSRGFAASATKQFKTTDELPGKLSFLDEYWTVIKQEQSVLICHIARMHHSKITLSLEINESCSARVHVSVVEVKKLGDYKIPCQIKDSMPWRNCYPTLTNVVVRNPLLTLQE